MSNNDVSNGIKEQANKNNILGLRINIMNDIVLYSSNLTYKNIIDFIKEKNIDIFEDNDSSDFKLNKEAWTEDYLVSVRTDLKFNFSSEKLEHFNDVAVYRANNKIKVKKEASSSINKDYEPKIENNAAEMINQYKEKNNRTVYKTNPAGEEKMYEKSKVNDSARGSSSYSDDRGILKLILILAIIAGGFYSLFKIVQKIF